MKNFLKSPVLLSLLIVSIFIGCSKDKDKPKIPTEPSVTYNISGRVVDDSGTPISGAKVLYIYGNMQGEATATTDANGKYSFLNLEIGEYTITVTKSGYTYGQTFAEITENGAKITDVILKNLSVIEERVEVTVTAAEIKESGIVIETEVEANVSLGEGSGTETVKQKVEAAIPPQTVITINDVVQEEITLAAAPLEVNEIPPPPEDEMPMGAAIFEPVDAKFDKPVEVSIPIEIQLPPGLPVPLKKFEAGEWKEVGTAIIDETGLGADAEVTEFGMFALQPKIDISETASEPEETEGQKTEIPQDQDVVETEVTDSVEFPGGLPEGITQEYAISLIEKIKGIDIGISKTLSLDLPQVTKAAAKPASPLSSDKIEPWIQTCTLTIVNIVTGETVTLDIDLGGTFFSFTIEFTYTQQTAVLECTSSWIEEHQQGGTD